MKIAIRLKDAAFEFEGQPIDGPAIFPLAEKWIDIVKEQGAASHAELHAAVADLKKELDAQRAAVVSNQ